MIIDHTDPDSISHNSHLVMSQLRRLRLMMTRLPHNKSMMVRLHSDERGELWFNTGDPKYDTQVGVAQVQVTLSALDSDEQLLDLASILVRGIAEQLAERAA